MGIIDHEVSMSLRLSTEDEKEWTFLPMLFSLTRYSRARGNPGRVRGWMPVFTGMTDMT